MCRYSPFTHPFFRKCRGISGGCRGLPTHQQVGIPGPMLQSAAAAHDSHSCFSIISALQSNGGFHSNSGLVPVTNRKPAGCATIGVCSALSGFILYINSLPNVVVLELGMFQTTNQGRQPSQTDSNKVRQTQKQQVPVHRGF